MSARGENTSSPLVRLRNERAFKHVMMGGDAYAGVWEHYATLAAINTALWLLSLLLGKTWPVRRTRLSSLSPQLAGLRGEAFRLAGFATALAFFLLQKRWHIIRRKFG